MCSALLCCLTNTSDDVIASHTQQYRKQNNLYMLIFFLQDSDILNLGTGSVSWFESNGYGCRPIYPTNITSEDPFRPVRPEQVDNCLLDYAHVEIIHSAVQLLLSVGFYIVFFSIKFLYFKYFVAAVIGSTWWLLDCANIPR